LFGIGLYYFWFYIVFLWGFYLFSLFFFLFGVVFLWLVSCGFL